MRSYKYSGSACTLGRFGTVSRGQVLRLTEQEADCVCGNKAFTEQREKLPEGFPEGEPPPRGMLFDVSALPWAESGLHRTLSHMRRKRLEAALSQLSLSGYPVPPLRSLSADELRDLIAEIGRKAGWL